jgi:hypothetical protein
MNKKNVPDLKLEQYLLGELKPSEVNELKKQLTTDECLLKRLTMLKQSEKDFSEQYPTDWLKKRIGIRESMQDITSRSLKLALIPVLCTLIIVPILLVGINRNNHLLASSERTKGEIHSLSVYRKTDLGHEFLTNGTVTHKGDLLQLEYSVSDSLLFGMILSFDGNGNTTIHLGNSDGTSIQLAQRRKMLPFSYELDDAPDFEKFFFITSRKSFVLNDCINLCKSMGKETVCSTRFTINMLTLNKVSTSE